MIHLFHILLYLTPSLAKAKPDETLTGSKSTFPTVPCLSFQSSNNKSIITSRAKGEL